MTAPPPFQTIEDFIRLITEGEAPSINAVAEALDRLALAMHGLPTGEPSELDLEPPDTPYNLLYEALTARFPDFGWYPVVDPLGSSEDPVGIADAADDLADIIRDMQEVLWRYRHLGADDAYWYLNLMELHWGRHMRELALYLHVRRSSARSAT
jgi:hypothetical protein